MKQIKIVSLFFVLLLLAGCGSKEPVTEAPAELRENQIYLYYVNKDKTDIVPVVYTMDQKKSLKQDIIEVIKMLSEANGSEEYISAIPEGAAYIGSGLETKYNKVDITFNIVYDTIEADSLLLFKCCVVKTLLQLEGADTVALSLRDITNSDEETATKTEIFDQSSFTMSFGKQNGYTQTGTIILYFANESGDYLKEYHKNIEISNNTSLPKLVVDSLIAGPEESGYTPTLSDKTTIKNISVKDGICYVDLSDEFYETDNPLKNNLIVYSIVNSLTELPTVSKVQFLRNGEKQEFFRESMPFDGSFEQNLDLIK